MSDDAPLIPYHFLRLDSLPLDVVAVALCPFSLFFFQAKFHANSTRNSNFICTATMIGKIARANELPFFSYLLVLACLKFSFVEPYLT